MRASAILALLVLASCSFSFDTPSINDGGPADAPPVSAEATVSSDLVADRQRHAEAGPAELGPDPEMDSGSGGPSVHPQGGKPLGSSGPPEANLDWAPAVAYSVSKDDFLVVWPTTDSTDRAIVGAWLDKSGGFAIHTTKAPNKLRDAAVVYAQDKMIIAWSSFNLFSDWNIASETTSDPQTVQSLASGPDTHRRADIARLGDKLGVVYQTTTGSDWNIAAREASLEGSPNTMPNVLSITSGVEPTPKIAALKNEFLVVWAKGSDPAKVKVQGIWLSSELSPGTVFDVALDASSPDVACQAARCLVAWRQKGGAILTGVLNAGALTTSTAKVVAAAGQAPAVARTSANRYLVAWQDLGNDAGDIVAVGVSDQGGASPLLVDVARLPGSIQAFPRVASDGTAAAVVAWLDNRSGAWETYAAKIVP